MPALSVEDEKEHEASSSSAAMDELMVGSVGAAMAGSGVAVKEGCVYDAYGSSVISGEGMMPGLEGMMPGLSVEDGDDAWSRGDDAGSLCRGCSGAAVA
eukprot:2208328-Rhodomonas_salina.1